VTQALREDITKRTKTSITSDSYAGYKYVRVFVCMAGDADTHRAAELALGSVLPTKWGGVATSTAVDPRLVTVVERGHPNSSSTQFYTEWVQITGTATGTAYENSTFRSKSDIVTGDWTGYVYHRTFFALTTDVAALRAGSLAPGAVLPVAWGGVATSTAIDPRLTSVTEIEHPGSTVVELRTQWTEILGTGVTVGAYTIYETAPSKANAANLASFRGTRTCIMLTSQTAGVATYYDIAQGANHAFTGATGAYDITITGYNLAPMADRPLCTRLTMEYTETRTI